LAEEAGDEGKAVGVVDDLVDAAADPALRMARGETQAQFAEVMGVSPNTVQRWEAGVMPPTQGVILQRLDQLLEELTLVQRQRFDEWVGEPTLVCPHCATNTPRENGGDVNRRDALEALFAALAEGAGLTVPPLPAYTDEPVDAALVTDYERGLALLASGYLKGNPRVMLPSAAGFAKGLAPVLRRVPTHEFGLRLAAVAVDAHALAGILAFNAGDPVAALHHVVLSCHYAETSGDPLLRARAYATRAKHLYSPQSPKTSAAGCCYPPSTASTSPTRLGCIWTYHRAVRRRLRGLRAGRQRLGLRPTHRPPGAYPASVHPQWRRVVPAPAHRLDRRTDLSRAGGRTAVCAAAHRPIVVADSARSPRPPASTGCTPWPPTWPIPIRVR
jgi:transcriptional regulator with XRE-family HTH domain